MDDRQASFAILDLVCERLPNADADSLAALLRELRQDGLRRRREARQRFTEALLEHVPPDEHERTREALAWLFGKTWLPPATEDVARVVTADHQRDLALQP